MAKAKAKTKIKKAAKKPTKKTVKKVVKAHPKKTNTAKLKSQTKSKSAVKKKVASQKSVKPSVIKTVSKQVLQKISPLQDRVLVEAIETERVTAGGLIIPDTASISGNKRGIVLAVGRGSVNKKGQLRPLELRVGDQVLFAEYSGTQLQAENQNLVVLRENEVLGVVDK